jgi:hypothetical protein
LCKGLGTAEYNYEGKCEPVPDLPINVLDFRRVPDIQGIFMVVNYSLEGENVWRR